MTIFHDRPDWTETDRALRAVLSRTGPVSIAPDDLDLADDLELVVRDAPFGDPPGSKILEASKPGDPRRDRILLAISRRLAREDGARIDLDVDALVDAILAELDR